MTPGSFRVAMARKVQLKQYLTRILFLVTFFEFITRTAGQNGGDIVTVGNDEGTDTGIPDLTGDVFLVDSISVSGSVFAVSAYFREVTNASFQIWRPIASSSNTDAAAKQFKLIWQITVSPTASKSREYVYMEAKFIRTCAFVEPGDWFGVLLLTSPSAIGATFTTNAPNVPLMNVKVNSQGLNLGYIGSFDTTFIYPYLILIAAYIDTDLISMGINGSVDRSKETIQCPTGLFLPTLLQLSQTTTVIPLSLPPLIVTYPPGAIGATGPRGMQGQNGTIGIIGPPGMKGNQGAPGPPGNPGPEGSIGSQGGSGIQGVKGPNGVIGLPGPSGLKGGLGEMGIMGELGPPGNNTYEYDNSPSLILSPDMESDGGLADRVDLRRGVIIWLAILSALVVLTSFLVLLVCYFLAEDKRIQKNETAWVEPELNRHIFR